MLIFSSMLNTCLCVYHTEKDIVLPVQVERSRNLKKNRNPSNIDRDMAKNAKTGSSLTTDVILRRFTPKFF